MAVGELDEVAFGGAQREPRVRLTTLLHHVTVDALRWAFFELKRNASAGADGMTWGMFEEGLEGRLAISMNRERAAGGVKATKVVHPCSRRLDANAKADEFPAPIHRVARDLKRRHGTVRRSLLLYRHRPS